MNYIVGFSKESEREFNRYGFHGFGNHRRGGICPNCNRLIEHFIGYFYEIKPKLWIPFCSKECLLEFIKNGKREAILL